MKERIKNLYKITLLTITMIVLQACGGGTEDPTAKYSISADTTSISFANEFRQESSDTYTVKVNFEGNGLLVGFAPDSQAVAWLNYRTENVTSTSATIHIDVVDAQNFLPELLETKIRLTTGDVDNLALVHHDIDVSLLVWELSTNTETIVFNGTYGEQSVQNQVLTINSDNNSWQAAVDVDWLNIDVNEGEGSGEITVAANISNFNQPGLYQAALTLTEKTTGDKKVIPVEVGLDNLYLFANRDALLFSNTTDTKATSHTITISHNSPVDIEWQATSDLEWLSTIKNNDQLTVQVDIANADNIELSTGNITISATNNDNVIDLTLPVTLFNSLQSTQPVLLEELSINNNAFISAPNMPYTYVGVSNELRIYHQYTGELVNSIVVAPENTLLDQFVIHPSGEYILARAIENVVDQATQTTTQETHRYRITLNELTSIELTDTTIELEPIDFINIAGRYFVVTQALELADKNLQQLYFDRENFFSTNQVNQAKVSGSLWAIDPSNAMLKRFATSANDFTSKRAVLNATHEYRPELLPEGASISSFIVDDSELGIYAISETSEWISFDGENFIDHGLLPQADGSTTLALTKSVTGEALFARYNAIQGFVVDVYNNKQEQTNSIQTFGPQPTGIKSSADNNRLSINAPSSQQIQFINFNNFKLSQSTVAFNTTFADASVDPQSITLTGVGSNWTAQSSADWLSLTTNDSNEGSSLELAIDTSKITSWGLLTATVEIFDPQSNSTRLIAVTIAVDAVRLSSSYPALQFNQLATKQQLSHTVEVLNNSENSISWSAATTAQWLALSTNGNSLQVTALPNMVTEDNTYYADIIISSDEEGAALSGIIKVALNKASADANEVVLSDISINVSGSVLDPLRPLLYAASGDAIKIFNILTGNEISSIQSPLAGVNLTNLVIHPDGSMLLASNLESYTDDSGQSQTRVNHYKVDLNDLTIEQIVSTENTIRYRPESIAIVSGEAIVITQGLELANLALETQYWNSDTLVESSQITDIKISDQILAFNAATNSIVKYNINYNAYADSTISGSIVEQFDNANYNGNMSAITTSLNGENVYTASVASEWASLVDGSYVDQGTLHNNAILSSINASVDTSDNIYFYRLDLNFGYTISKYDNTQQLIWAAIFSNGSNQVFVSPSYQRIMSFNSATSELIFDSLP